MSNVNATHSRKSKNWPTWNSCFFSIFIFCRGFWREREEWRFVPLSILLDADISDFSFVVVVHRCISDRYSIYLSIFFVWDWDCSVIFILKEKKNNWEIVFALRDEGDCRRAEENGTKLKRNFEMVSYSSVPALIVVKIATVRTNEKRRNILYIQ